METVFIIAKIKKQTNKQQQQKKKTKQDVLGQLNA